MASSPTSFFVPTLDIDLAWHTHQLMADQYNSDCFKFVERYIDQYVDVNHFRSCSTIYLDTVTTKLKKLSYHLRSISPAELGRCDRSSLSHLPVIYPPLLPQDRFDVQYTHCGCPLPGETIGQKLSRLVRPNGSYRPFHLIPPEQDDLLSATHPSDHNAVFAFHHKARSEAAQRRRREKISKRQQKANERVKSGKLDPKGEGQVHGHDAAFLVPVPLYYMPVVAGCAMVTGAIVNNSGAGGIGGCATVSIVFEHGVDCHTDVFCVSQGAGTCGAGGVACGSGESPLFLVWI